MPVSKKPRAKPDNSPQGRSDRARRAAVTRANGALRANVADEAERGLYADAVARYADACATAERARAEWEAEGCPMTAEGSMRQPIPHPLVKMISDADALAAKFAAAVGLDLAAKPRRRGAGRPTGAVSAPDRVAGAPPKIRRVK